MLKTMPQQMEKVEKDLAKEKASKESHISSSQEVDH